MEPLLGVQHLPPCLLEFVFPGAYVLCVLSLGLLLNKKINKQMAIVKLQYFGHLMLRADLMQYSAAGKD